MANFKVVISDPASKKAYQKVVDQAQSGLIGKKIGEKVSGNNLDLNGYELEITGGSDKDGFPMRPDVDGTARKKIILTAPPGYHPEKYGKRKRKSVRGNTIAQDISQVNVKVVKAGTKKLEELIGAKKKAEEKPDEKGATVEKKEEAKPETGKEEKPKAEEKKEPAKKEAAKTEAKADEKLKEGTEKVEAKMGVKKLEESGKEGK